MIQVADYFGVNVAAVDTTAHKLDRCAAVGASRVHDPGPENDLVALADETYDAVIDFTGATTLFESCVDLLGPRGRLVNLTIFPGNEMSLSPRTEVMNEVEVVGSRYCSKYEIQRAAHLVADGVVDPVVSEVTNLNGTPDLLRELCDGAVVGRGAMRPE